MAPPPDLVGLFVRPLEEIGIQYMITGGVASVIYGDPRFTRDVDVVLELKGRDVDTLIEAFDSDAFYMPPVEVVHEELGRSSGGHFNIIHRDTALRADVYLAGSDSLHSWAFPRRLRLDLGELSIWVAPVEYVIVRKLEYYRDSGSDRHLRDISMMLRISEEAVDQKALENWCEALGLSGRLSEAKAYDVE
ncbi:MAG: nucleotidyl transferase AbiEii/AbiGii toxin family protein [Gemmatimonadota bacterium]